MYEVFDDGKDISWLLGGDGGWRGTWAILLRLVVLVWGRESGETSTTRRTSLEERLPRVAKDSRRVV